MIAAETGHVSVHEAGAIEFTGHKVLTLPQHDGKLCARELKDYMETFLGDDSHEHMVFPGMVYISHPTEYGTLYTKDELKELSQVCRRFKLPLYMDGARLITGLACPENELSLPDIADLCDIFYIGGTKAGALCGEAVVLSKNKYSSHIFLLRSSSTALFLQREGSAAYSLMLFFQMIFIRKPAEMPLKQQLF